MKTRTIKRTPIFLVLLCFLLSMNSALPVFPLENIQTEAIEEAKLQETILYAEFLSAEAVQSAGHIKRLTEEEPNLNTAVFENEDGTYTLYAFSQAIKYVDESGAIKDKSNTLTASFTNKSYEANYAYGIENNEFKTYFPKTLSETSGVLLNTNGHTIAMFAKGSSIAVEQIEKFSPENVVIYPKVFGASTLLRYTPTLTGYKEELVLGTPGNGNSFKFVLDVGDLTAEVLPNGGIGLYASSGDLALQEEGSVTREEAGYITPPQAYDANGNGIQNTQITLLEVDTGIYELTLVVDAGVLSSEQTAYPVTVNATVVLPPSNGTAKVMEDAYIANTSNSIYRQWNGSGLVVSHTPTSAGYNESRTLIRFPGLTDSTNTGSNLTFLRNHAAVINSAEVWLYDSVGGTQTAWVDVYAYLSTWSEADGTVKTITGDTFNNSGSFVSTRGVGNNAGYSAVGSTTAGRWYDFSFAKSLREWVTASPTASYGSATMGIVLCPYYEEESTIINFRFNDTEANANTCYVVNYSDYTHYNWRWLFDDEENTKNISSGYKLSSRPDHYAIDLSENKVSISGKEIKAPSNGKVVAKGYESSTTNGRGHYLIVETYVKDLYTEQYLRLVFMHMQEASPLSVGDTFTAGTLLGKVGTTGASTGPHLHFSVIRNGATTENASNTLNPQRFFDVDFGGKTSTVRP